MFAGHLGAALAIGRTERRINVGVFILAALLLDIVLWALVLLGWESVVIPEDFTGTRQPVFVFPYSHGLLSSIGWSVLAAIALYLFYPRLKDWRLRAATLVGLAVFSHWLLDALVHVRELPLAGVDSTKVGLGLWQDMPVAVVAKTAIVVAGLYLFVPGSSITRIRKFWLTVLALLVLAFTVAGVPLAPPPPSATAMAGSSLATIIAICAFACWLGRLPDQT